MYAYTGMLQLAQNSRHIICFADIIQKRKTSLLGKKMTVLPKLILTLCHMFNERNRIQSCTLQWSTGLIWTGP